MKSGTTVKQERGLPPPPKDWSELGVQLSRFRHRADLSLAAAATAVGRSAASLHRYEAGSHHLPAEVAVAMDAAYGTKGWIVAASGDLRFSNWVWHPRGTPRARWLHQWDASYDDQVWIGLIPAAGRAGRDHRGRLDWGAWTREVGVALPRDGVVLVTGKAEDLDRPASTLELTITPGVMAFFGVGEPTNSSAQVIDIRIGWRRRDDPT